DSAYRVFEYFLSDSVGGPTFASLLAPLAAFAAFPRLEVYSRAISIGIKKCFLFLKLGARFLLAFPALITKHLHVSSMLWLFASNRDPQTGTRFLISVFLFVFSVHQFLRESHKFRLEIFSRQYLLISRV